MRAFHITLASLALVATVAAQAQHAPRQGGIRYRWHDDKGLPHYSDSLTADAMKYGYDMVNDQGMVVGHVQRQLSADERAAAEKLAAEQASAQREREAKQRADLQLLNTYGDEASLQRALQEQLDTIDQQIETTRINLHSQESALTDLLDRAADLERARQPIPKSLSDSIARQRTVVADQRTAMARQKADRSRMQQANQVQLEHYRALRQAQRQAKGY